MRVINKLLEIAEKHPEILVKKEDLSKAEGFSLPYYKSIGLGKNDLRRLERLGVAIRGYSQNIWVSGDTLPNGKVVPGEMAIVEVEKTKQYLDTRKYVRTMKYTEEVKVPQMSVRGNGHKPLWIIVI